MILNANTSYAFGNLNAKQVTTNILNKVIASKIGDFIIFPDNLSLALTINAGYSSEMLALMHRFYVNCLLPFPFQWYKMP